MNKKEILNELNILSRCKEYGVSTWQCPQFLFLIMGLIIGGTSIGSFMIGTRFITDPALVALIVLIVSAVLFVLSFLIVRSFERLAEANRMKSEFVSVVSHQLRSPLSNLGWALEIMMSGKMGDINGKQLDYFKILKDNVSRMKDLASDLIVVSRIETAALPINKESFSLGDLVEKIMKEFKAFARASNVKLVFDKEDNLPLAYGDASQVSQVFGNLLDNAIRYTEGGGEVKVTAKRKGKNLYLEVKDSGVGIPEDDQKHIFQKFFRSSNIMRYQTQGSGLGLFIAKSIIERSGGNMGFSSKEGKGSTFWFTLPVKK